MTKCAITSEEEELTEEQSKLFPTFESDYQEEAATSKEPSAELGMLMNHHLHQVSKLHMQIVRQHFACSWMNGADMKMSHNFKLPLHMR